MAKDLKEIRGYLEYYALDEKKHIRKHSPAKDALAKLDAIIERLDSKSDILNPRTWTTEMSDAWHSNIPDTQQAFDALRKIIKGKNQHD